MKHNYIILFIIIMCQFSSRYSLAQKKISTNGNSRVNLVESDMDKIIEDKFHKKFRIINDGDKNWDSYEFDNFVSAKRKKYKYYPFIAKGDFDGDGNMDFAAEVIKNDNSGSKLVVVWGSGANTEYNVQLCSAISVFPVGKETKSRYSSDIDLKNDAIFVECFEKSSWLLYWDGRSFQQHFLTD